MDATLATFSYTERPIVDKTHSPVIFGGTLAADQDVLEAGTILAKVSGSYVAYDSTASDGSEVAAGVLTARVDTTGEAKVGSILVHGTVVADNLLEGASAADADAIAALRAINIYAL